MIAASYAPPPHLAAPMYDRTIHQHCITYFFFAAPFLLRRWSPGPRWTIKVRVGSGPISFPPFGQHTAHPLSLPSMTRLCHRNGHSAGYGNRIVSRPRKRFLTLLVDRTPEEFEAAISMMRLVGSPRVHARTDGAVLKWYPPTVPRTVPPARPKVSTLRCASRLGQSPDDVPTDAVTVKHAYMMGLIDYQPQARTSCHRAYMTRGAARQLVYNLDAVAGR